MQGSGTNKQETQNTPTDTVECIPQDERETVTTPQRTLIDKKKNM